MAGQKRNKFGLSIDSTVVHKKYLGDPNDPHYEPDSPLIDRKHLSEQEEKELRRSCAIALARVPHSDDTPADPLSYLGPHVQRKSIALASVKPRPQTAIESKSWKRESTAAKRHQAPSRPQVPQIPASMGSSTCSEADRTDCSTPLTSAGITPGETNKRFSDAARLSSHSTTNKASSKTKSRAASTSQSRQHKSADTNMVSRILTKDSTSASKQAFVSAHETTAWPSNLLVSDHVAAYEAAADLHRLSQFDKQLPPLPPTAVPTHKPSMGRLFKSIKKAKSSHQILAYPRSMSSAEQTHVSAMPEILTLRKPATDLVPNNGAYSCFQPPPSAPSSSHGCDPTSNPNNVTTTTKRKFRLRKFLHLRKESSAPIAIR